MWPSARTADVRVRGEEWRSDIEEHGQGARIIDEGEPGNGRLPHFLVARLSPFDQAVEALWITKVADDPQCGTAPPRIARARRDQGQARGLLAAQ